MARIADYLELLLLDVVRRPERPAFTRMAERRDRRGRGPRPDGLVGLPRHDARLRRRAEDGMKLQGVSEGSPAEKGGLKGGDVIIGLGDKTVGTIYDYMEGLGRTSRATRSTSWSSATARR